MITDVGQARDQINAALWAAWQAADWTTILGSPTLPVIAWDGLDDGKTRDPNAPYAAIFIKHIAAPQATFRGPFGQPQRYTASGFVTVQVFAPISSRNGTPTAEKMAIIAQSAYRGGSTPDGIWFTNVVAKEVGAGEGYYQFNVVANFSYDTVQ